jgi:hypothetical protein
VSKAILVKLLGRPLAWLDDWSMGRHGPPPDLSVCAAVRDGRVCGKTSTGIPYGSGPYGACPEHEAEILEAAAKAEEMLRGER